MPKTYVYIKKKKTVKNIKHNLCFLSTKDPCWCLQFFIFSFEMYFLKQKYIW